MNATSLLQNISIVLNRPRYPENIGAAARAMCNMGMRHLVLVRPENFDRYRALTLATHAAAEVIHNARVYEDLKSALAEFGYVAGTTARLGSRRQMIVSPEKMAGRLIPICQNNRVAVLFGPEDRGLTNPELRYCHGLVNIPTAEFSSINLAHSVMIVCYELFKAGMSPPREFAPRLATRHELDAMYEQLKETLVRISFIQADNPDHWLDRFRRFFSRLPLRSGEVSLVRGVCRQINWYAAKCYKDAKAGRSPDPALGIAPEDDS